MAAPNTIAVIGGGIGGLTAALPLLKCGLDVDVYEQSARLREVGAGIQISPNGTRVLYALGLEEALRGVQVSPSRKEIRHWSTGENWTWYELGPSTTQRYGTPHILLHRGDLHGILADAVGRLKPNAIHLAKRCVDVAQSDQHVEARFQTGETVSAAFVVGADGIHSKVRACLFGSDRPQFTGCIAWRGAVPMQRLPAHISQMLSTNWLGPRGHVLHYPIRRGELMNFVGVVERDDWQIEAWTVEGTTSELENDFRGWHPDVHAIIQNIDTPFKWALMVRAPMERWTKERITLLGDACHATLPFLGQGGVMAIEDGYVIGACLKKHFADPATAFARYEDIRRQRTAAVVRKAHEFRKQAFNPALGDGDTIAVSVAEQWQQALARERLDWLYEYDATAVRI
ncbi:MAG TPA: FAD-dependent monooxygenase [Xanthobacteraceae bacterium]|nr:FAD-dependent monooxygenase [Xanthobacteraceae bacterium]